jgi:hypothetical protein
MRAMQVHASDHMLSRANPIYVAHIPDPPCMLLSPVEDSSGAEQPSAEANAELEAPAAKESVGASMQTLLQMEEDVLDEELAALRMQLQVLSP